MSKAKRFIEEGIEGIDEYIRRVENGENERSWAESIREFFAMTACFQGLLRYPPASAEARREIAEAYETASYFLTAVVGGLSLLRKVRSHLVAALGTYK